MKTSTLKVLLYNHFVCLPCKHTLVSCGDTLEFPVETPLESPVGTPFEFPGGKIIDCGPVGPLMMDLSPSCWEGPSPSHFKGPGALALSMDQVHHIAKGLKSIPH